MSSTPQTLVCYFLFFLRFTYSLPLNEYAILMSHDAATGDLHREHIVAEWAITQSTGLDGQLDCGARAFDYRPYYENGVLYAHHGGVKVPYPMEDAVSSVISWCSTHEEEFVLLYVNSCDGDSGCMEAAIALLESMQVPVLTSCSDVDDLTFEDAYSISTLPRAGHLLAVVDCVEEYYDSSINCYGHQFVCYDSWPENTSTIPWNAMETYLQDVTSELPVEEGRLWMAQAHWQSTALSISLGTLHNSSLLLDETRSGVNSWFARAITDGAYSHLNIIEVDNVCDGGLELLSAIKKWNS